MSDSKNKPVEQAATQNPSLISGDSDTMSAKKRGKTARTALVAGEGFAVFILLVLILASVIVWRLKSGPVDISFANDYVESALKNDETGMYATIDKSALYWPDLNGPLLLGLQGGSVIRGNTEILSVDEIALSLSKSKLLIGKIQPLSLIVTRPTIRAIRNADNTLDFGFGTLEDVASEAISDHVDEQRDFLDEILDMIEDKEVGKNTSSPLSSLKTFQIVDAQVMVEDHKIGASWFFPDFNILFEKARYGLSAKMDVALPEIKGEESFVKAQLLLDRDAGTIEAITNVENFDLRIFSGKIEGLEILNQQDVVLDANVIAKLDDNLVLESLRGELLSPSGGIYSETLSAVPVPYENMQLQIDYTATPDGKHKLNVPNLQITTKGVTLRGRGQVKSLYNENEEDFGYGGPIELVIDDMPHSLIAPLWPVALEGDNSQEWIVDKMSGGELKDLKAEALLALFKGEDGEWQGDVQNVLAHFAFTDLNLNYRDPLPAVTQANGSGQFDLDKDVLDIKIEQAEMSGLAVSNAHILFTEVVAEGRGHITMDMGIEGALDKVFSYISTDPIDLGDELDTDISKVKGDTELKVKLDFPTKSDLAVEEINMDIEGNIENGFMPNILEGLPISGGPFKVKVNNERYTVSGSGELDGRALDFEWMEYIDSKDKKYKNRAKASISVDQDLREHFGIDISDFIEGDLPADIVYTGYADGKAKIDIDADVSPARLMVKSFQYEKEEGKRAFAKLSAHLNNNELKRISDFSAEAPQFKLADTAITFRGNGDETEVAKADIGQLVVGETISKAVIEISPQGVMSIVMNGAFLDLRPFLNGDEQGQKEPYDDPPMKLSLSMDQMRTADKETVQYGKIYADIDDQGRFNQLEMDAIAGKGDIYLRFKTNVQGVRTFRLEADDAGAALKAFGVYDSIRGGKLQIYAEPIRGVFDRNLIGSAQMTDFRVVNAPALARLIGAISLPGVLQSLNGEGLVFSKLESDFDWLYRRQGSLLVLKNGRSSGNSLGLTFDGVFDNGAHVVDVNGTIIPLSGINNAIGAIPLFGDIITGGTGSLFAATYSMKGPSENPDIDVNPLSVITPGILRRILFE